MRPLPLRGRSTLIRRPRAKNGVAVRKRPCFSSTATTGSAHPASRSADWSASSRGVFGLSFA